MPSVRGLYDNDDADTESLSNQLSPSDGYFNERSHPQEVLVPDPSQATAAADKASEAQADEAASQASEASAVSRPLSQYTPPFTPTRRRFDPDYEFHDDGAQTDTTPLIPHGAPPAYSTATAGNTYQSMSDSQPIAGSRRTGYFTLGREQESLRGEPLLGYREDDGDNWKSRIERWLRFHLKLLGKIFVILLALAAAFGFIVDVFSRIHKKNSTAPINGEPGQDQHDLPRVVYRSCPLGIHTGRATFEFPHSWQSNFTFQELVRGVERSGSARQVRTQGEMHIRPAIEHLECNIRMEIKMYFSESDLIAQAEFHASDEELTLYTPSHMLGHHEPSDPTTCMYFVVDVWIAPGTQLDFLSLQSQSLETTLHKGLSIKANAMSLASITGDIKFPSSPSGTVDTETRRIKIRTDTGSITGAYPLYDLLQIHSHAGSIKIDVLPKDASKTHPLPAKLKIESGTGSINVGTPMLVAAQGDHGAIISVPNRDYETEIFTSSGSITVDVIHGSSIDLKTIAGSMKARLSPYGSPDLRSDIKTHSKAGSQDITLLPSLSHSGSPLRNLYGDYNWQSGNLIINYPDEWEGHLEGRILTGSVSVDWPGMQMNGNPGRGPHTPWRISKGVKGHGDSMLKFRGLSGSATLKGGYPTSWDRGERWDNREDEGWPVPVPTEVPVVEYLVGGLPPPSRGSGHVDEWEVTAN